MNKYKISIKGEPDDIVIEADRVEFKLEGEGAPYALFIKENPFCTVLVANDFIYWKDITNEKD